MPACPLQRISTKNKYEVLYHFFVFLSSTKLLKYVAKLPPFLLITYIYSAKKFRRRHPRLSRVNIIQKTHLCQQTKVRFLLAEMERFELSRRDNRPTPLAGAPLRPLEYISIYSVSCRLHPLTGDIISQWHAFVKRFPKIKKFFFVSLVLCMAVCRFRTNNREINEHPKTETEAQSPF